MITVRSDSQSSGWDSAPSARPDEQHPIGRVARRDQVGSLIDQV
jgi:hypothetical protein